MKKIIVPALMLIGGLIPGYFVGKSKSTLISDKAVLRQELLAEINSNSLRLSSPNKSREIDSALAKKLIAEYEKQNNNSPAPILNADSVPLKGFYINKAPFLKILNDKTFVGISFYFAKNHLKPGTKENYYSLIFMGAREKPESQRASPGDSLENGPPYYNYIDPCPTVCGGF